MTTDMNLMVLASTFHVNFDIVIENFNDCKLIAPIKEPYKIKDFILINSSP